ncbi:hypothetical protein ACE6H2_011669 [Prunus campanulata]
MAETKRKWVRTRELGEDEGGGLGLNPPTTSSTTTPHYSIFGSGLHDSLKAGLLTCALPLERVYVGLIQIGFNYFVQRNIAIPTEL